MKLTLIKEDVDFEKSIVDEVMETDLLEDDKNEDESKEVANDEETEVTTDAEPSEVDIPELDFSNTDENGEPELKTEVEPNPEPELEEPNPQPDMQFEDTPIEDNSEKAVVVYELNSIVDTLWSLTDNLKHIASNPNVDNQEDFKKIINSIVDDVTINIGMVYKLMSICNPELEVLINKGRNKAEETLINKEE